MRILVVEDEPKVAQALKTGLSGEGYEVTLAATGEDGFFLISSAAFDFVILDIMLPGRDGLEMLAAMRKLGQSTPVLILSARDTVDDRIKGLDLGADDYLVKPFAFDELLARIRALLRRGRPEEALRLKVADVEMDLVTRSVRRAGMALELTTREFELLEFLLRHQGSLVSREMIARDVWKTAQRATPLDNVIDVHIGRLRRKLDDGHTQKLIHTLRGVGFTLREDAPT